MKHNSFILLAASLMFTADKDKDGGHGVGGKPSARGSEEHRARRQAEAARGTLLAQAEQRHKAAVANGTAFGEFDPESVPSVDSMLSKAHGSEAENNRELLESEATVQRLREGSRTVEADQQHEIEKAKLEKEHRVQDETVKARGSAKGDKSENAGRSSAPKGADILPPPIQPGSAVGTDTRSHTAGEKLPSPSDDGGKKAEK